MEYGPSYSHNSSMYKPWTGHSETSSFSSSPSRKSAVSIIITLPSRSKEREAKLSDREWNSSFVEQRTWSFIKFISFAQIIVFVYHVILLSNKGVTVNIGYGPVYRESLLIYNPLKKKEVWRYVTNMFLHNGYIHIASNVIVQLVIGPSLEKMHGWWRVMLIYLAGVTTGSLTAAVVIPGHYLGGASTGVFSLITAHFANAFFNWQEMKFTRIKIFKILGFILFSVYSLKNSVVGLYNTYSAVGGPAAQGQHQVSHMGHLTGAVVGLLLGNVFLKLRNLRSYKTWKKAIWWYSLLVFLLFFIGAIFMNIFSGHNLEDDIDFAKSFRTFDIDGDNLITVDEMMITMRNLGEPVNYSEVKEGIAEFDLDGDGKLNLKEFHSLFLKYIEEENSN